MILCILNNNEEIKTYYNNEQLCVHCFYKGSKLHGEYKLYYENGKLQIDSFYKDGKKDGKYKYYYTNEKLQIHCFFKDDKKNGEYKEYYDNGQLYSHCFFKDDKKNGQYKSYRDNGQLFEYKNYKNYKLNGKYKKYYENILVSYNYYINNNPIIDNFIDNFNFKIEFALLRFRDVLKSKVRKPKYELLDKYFIKDISNIIATYLFTMSSLNPNGNRILI
jgi:hypothetical protein